MEGFFRRHAAFLSEEERGSPALSRLDARYQAIVGHRREAIEGARVLDIASHNGRWSLACLASGARHVTGVEARRELIDEAELHMQRYGISPDRYEFRCSDAHELVRELEPGRFDTILCLGFLYHTAHHFQLLEAFASLAPRYLIIDTAIAPGNGRKVVMQLEETAGRLMAFSSKPSCWTGKMTGPLLEEALVGLGFDVEYFDWNRFIRDLDRPCPGITETRYGAGTRVTIHARRRDVD